LLQLQELASPKISTLRFLRRKPPPPIDVPIFSTGAMPMTMATPRALIEVEEVQPPAIKKKALLIGIQFAREKLADVLLPISPLSPRIVANVDAGIQKEKSKSPEKERTAEGVAS